MQKGRVYETVELQLCVRCRFTTVCIAVSSFQILNIKEKKEAKTDTHVTLICVLQAMQDD